MTKQEFRDILGKHDWYYMYSDDHRYYTKGLQESRRIDSIVRVNPELEEVYNEYRARFIHKA